MHLPRVGSSLALLTVLAACSSNNAVSTPPDVTLADAIVNDVSPPDVAPTDIVAPDAPTDVSADAPTDAPADAGPSRCTSDRDCAGNPAGAACDTVSGLCVRCTAASDNCPTDQYCVASTATCAPGCRNDGACPGGGRCDVATHTCAECFVDAHCSAGNRCVGNHCAPGCSPTRPCPGVLNCCGESCVDTTSNTSNCGGCGMTCAPAHATPACVTGACALMACAAPFADCDMTVANGCETDTSSDPSNCGRCGAVATLANATATCRMGAPAIATCTDGFADCDAMPANGCEADTRTDAMNCGRCGTVATLPNATATCRMGAPAIDTCATGFADCNATATDGCETDTRTDAMNCGRCGNVATLPHATATCREGVAAVGTCATGFADCNTTAGDGCETDTRANNVACGACGHACTAGSLCEAGSCVADCRRGASVTCGSGDTCDYSDGTCRAEGTRCVLTGAYQACGAQSCGPGSACDPRTMTCVAGLSCRSVSCEPGTARCWGTDCPCDRPTAPCTTLPPASVPSTFLSGAFGFDIDDACNMYTATMLSGPDYVRRVDPSGHVTIWTSVANLNMGEVAVQRRINIDPAGTIAANVAFTYICCATCGCASTPPQGVGHVQSDGSLPVVVPSVITSGTGPFGVYYLDTGPYGLGVSSIGEFFVGNVHANGDWYRYDTVSRTITSVATLPARVTASTAFDIDTMLVAVSGGELYLVDRAPGGSTARIGSLGVDVQSVRRDAFTGRFYASLRGGRIVSFLPDVTGLRMETMAARGSRVAVSPDGWLYVLLEEGGPVSRVALPSSR